MEAPRHEDNAPPVPWLSSEESDVLCRSSRLGSYALKASVGSWRGIGIARRHPPNRPRKPTTPQSSRATSALAAAESATVPPTAGTDAVSDPGQADADTGEGRLAQEEPSGPDTRATIWGGSLDEAPGEPASSEATTPSSNECKS